MSSPNLNFKDRLFTNIGLISLLVFVIAIEVISVVQNWTYTVYAILIAVVALIVFLFIIRGSQLRKSCAPTNMQLQDIPPAIIEAHKNDN